MNRKTQNIIAVKRILVVSCKTLAIISIFSFGVVVGELSQILVSVDELRGKAIDEWASNEERKDIAERYTNECLLGRAPERDILTEPISLEQCANTNNTKILHDHLETKSPSLDRAAWPLSEIL